MRKLCAMLAVFFATPAFAQVSNPPIVQQTQTVDMSAYAKKTDIPTIPDMSGYATTTSVNTLATMVASKADASALTTLSNSVVKTINGTTPNASGAVTLSIPAAPDLTGYATTSALTSGLAGKADTTSVTSAISTAIAPVSTTANAAMTKANAACVGTPAVPGMEMVGGSAGTNNNQCRPIDTVQPRITRAGSCTLVIPAGTCSITWATAFPTGTNVNVVLEPINNTGSAVICNPVSAPTITSVSLKCWFARPLPATLTLLSNLVSYDVFGGTPTAITVQVTAIPATQ